MMPATIFPETVVANRLDADRIGESRLQIPPAAIVTTLGGIALIITHLGNLCACRTCRHER